jgi:hypothetical protein
MDGERFFSADEAIYESVRLSLDSAWGHGPDTGTASAYEPATAAPRSSDGEVLLAVRSQFAEYPAVAAVLPSLLESGAVREISEQTYRAALPQVP